MLKQIKRPSISRSSAFEDDLLSLLEKHHLVNRCNLIQKVKIIAEVDKNPFIEIYQMKVEVGKIKEGSLPC